jgi:membrane protein DedA with SNARE-associated domain
VVLLYGTLSALLWNALLLLLGVTVGESWDRLVSLFETYGLAFWCLVVIAVVALVVRHYARRRGA